MNEFVLILVTSSD